MNRYETLRGNAELGKMVFETENLTYNLSLKNYRLSATARHEGIHNIPKDDLYTEGDRLIHSFVSDGNIHTLSLQVSQTLFLLNRNLQLQGLLMAERSIVTGLHGGSRNQPYVRLNARYYAGHWSMYGFFETGGSYLALNNAYPADYKYPPDYGLSLTYSHRGFYAEAGARKLFAHDGFTEEWQHSELYGFNRQVYGNAQKPWLYVRLSYSFDFGRKTSHQDIDVARSSSSAILGK